MAQSCLFTETHSVLPQQADYVWRQFQSPNINYGYNTLFGDFHAGWAPGIGPISGKETNGNFTFSHPNFQHNQMTNVTLEIDYEYWGGNPTSVDPAEVDVLVLSAPCNQTTAQGFHNCVIVGAIAGTLSVPKNSSGTQTTTINFNNTMSNWNLIVNDFGPTQTVTTVSLRWKSTAQGAIQFKGARLITTYNSTALPVADFNASVTSIPQGGSVTFNDQTASLGSQCPHTVSWSFPGGSPTSSTSTQPTVTYNVPGTYNVSMAATNSNGSNTKTKNQHIYVYPTNLVANASTDKTICYNATTRLGPTTFNEWDMASGGTPPYTFSWSPQTGMISGGNFPTVQLTSAQTYTLLVTDANGVTATDQQTIFVNPQIHVSSGNQTICAGGSATLNGTATGGTPPFTYAWNNGGSLSNPTIANPVASPGFTTVYTVTVTDNAGCTRTASSTVNINSYSFNAGSNQTICEGQSTTLGSSSPSGGISPFTYSWGGNNGTFSLSSTTVAQPVANPLTSSTYTVTVTDGLGCIATDDVEIIVSNEQYPVVTVTDASCPQVCNGVLNMTISGGPAGINWSDGGEGVYRDNICGGNYTVTVTDQLGCNWTYGPFTVNAPVLTPPTITPVNSLCTEGVCDGFGYLVNNDGTAPYTYSWSNGDVTQDLIEVCPGNYDVTVTDADGCTMQANTTIVANFDVEVIDLGQGNESCNASRDGWIEVLGTGGTAPYTYNWTYGGTGALYENLAAGSYRVTVTDDQGCIHIQPYVVTDLGLNQMPQGSDFSMSGDMGHDITSDAQGNVYVVGEFGESTELTLGNGTISSGNSLPGMFVAKYNNCGDLLWRAHSDCTSPVTIVGLGVVADNGKVYVTGTFDGPSSSVDFISDNNSVTATSATMFVMSMEQSDGFINYVQTGNNGLTDPSSTAITVDLNGDLYLCGVSGSMQDQVFVYKADDLTGLAVGGWPITSTGNQGDVATDIYVNGLNQIYVGGYFQGGMFTLGGIPMAAGGEEAFLYRLDNNQNAVWGIQGGADMFSTSRIEGITSDGSSIYVVGSYNGQLQNYLSSGQQIYSPIPNLFVAAVDANAGAGYWFEYMEGAAGGQLNSAGGGDIAFDPENGTLYITGTYNGNIVEFSSYTGNPYNAGTGVDDDIFVAGMSVGGTVEWASPGFGGSNFKAGGVTASNGMAISTGQFTGLMELVPNQVLTNSVMVPSHYVVRNLPIPGQGEFYKTDVVSETQESGLVEEGPFTVFPNPNDGRFTVRLNAAPQVQANLSLQDALGRVVWEEPVRPGSTMDIPVDVRDLPKGLYLMKLVQGDQVQTVKVLNQ